MKPVVVVIDALERDELQSEMYDIVAMEGIKAVCAIPLVNRGRALGILSISRKTEIPFTSDDIDFLSQASRQIAIAIENALAYREISELKDKLSQEKLYLEEEIRSEWGFEEIVGNSTVLKHDCRERPEPTFGPAGYTLTAQYTAPQHDVRHLKISVRRFNHGCRSRCESS